MDFSIFSPFYAVNAPRIRYAGRITINPITNSNAISDRITAITMKAFLTSSLQRKERPRDP